jgi:hypothetical protein
MADEALAQESRPWTALQDPSALSLALIQREIAHLNAQINLRIDGIVLSYDTRIGAIDRATDKFETSLTRVPTDVDRQVGQLKAEILALLESLKQQLEGGIALNQEKFSGIQMQLRERDQKVTETALATKTAVDAALSAAEKATTKQADSFSEASAKNEAFTTKAIDQQAALYQTETRALRDISAAIDRRLTVIEGQAIGQQASRGETHTSSTFLVSLIALFIALAGVAVALLRPAVGH